MKRTTRVRGSRGSRARRGGRRDPSDDDARSSRMSRGAVHRALVCAACLCTVGAAPLDGVQAAARADSGAAPPPDSMAAPIDRGAAALADPNGHPFRTPSSSPLEPVHRLAAVGVSRGGEARATALAHLGDRLGFWIRRAPGPELSGAIHAGAFSRFDLERPDQEFLQVHYRAGFLLRMRAGPVAARAEIYHVSSHLGDEYLTRTGRDPISTSREGVELLVQTAPIRGLMLYGGPGILLRSSEEFEPLSVRAGGEWRQRPRPETGLYAAVDAFLWEESDWDPMISLEAGLAFGRHARLGALAGFGPSRAEQFFREEETIAGLAFTFTR